MKNNSWKFPIRIMWRGNFTIKKEKEKIKKDSIYQKILIEENKKLLSII